MEEGQSTSVIEYAELATLLAVLRREGYTPVGPVSRDGAIVYDELSELADLPRGWTDQQRAGEYRLEKREDNAVFGFALGPHSWKRYLFPPRLRLFSARRTGASFSVEEAPTQDARLAFVGVRACELAAIELQDRVFLSGDVVEPGYAKRRQSALLVAVQCVEAGDLCFCASLGAGPEVKGGFDLALTELIDAASHLFLVEVGSDRGQGILDQIPGRPVTGDLWRRREEAIARATASMGRQLQVDGLRELLRENPEHPRWEEVGARCLSCASCTMVCPTCFCSTVEDTTDLSGDHAERWRRWDSCFTADFSYLHGGSVRSSTKARYRQWLLHKLASGFDQFAACVGCGRCIAWCPAGIDITEEASAIRESTKAESPKGRSP